MTEKIIPVESHKRSAPRRNPDTLKPGSKAVPVNPHKRSVSKK